MNVNDVTPLKEIQGLIPYGVFLALQDFTVLDKDYPEFRPERRPNSTRK